MINSMRISSRRGYSYIVIVAQYMLEEVGTRSTKKTLFWTESTPQISTLKRRPKKLGFDGPGTGLSFVEGSS